MNISKSPCRRRSSQSTTAGSHAPQRSDRTQAQRAITEFSTHCSTARKGTASANISKNNPRRLAQIRQLRVTPACAENYDRGHLVSRLSDKTQPRQFTTNYGNCQVEHESTRTMTLIPVPRSAQNGSDGAQINKRRQSPQSRVVRQRAVKQTATRSTLQQPEHVDASDCARTTLP